MRAYLAAEEIHPELVLCSSALRTRETLAAVLPALGPDVVVRVEASVYAFDGKELFDVLRDVDPRVRSLMLVGHNPAMQELALALASRGDRLADVAEKFPTGALAEIGLPESSWSDLAEGSGELTRFVTPRELDA
jgi:phosphohistidine phosphatase